MRLTISKRLSFLLRIGIDTSALLISRNLRNGYNVLLKLDRIVSYVRSTRLFKALLRHLLLVVATSGVATQNKFLFNQF